MSTCRPFIEVFTSGTPNPSRRRSRSLRKYSIVFAAKASICTDNPSRAEAIACSTISGVCSTPSAIAVPSMSYTVAPSMRTCAPSVIAMICEPRSSMSGMPASRRIAGPRLGYLPEVDFAALSTARGFFATRASALTRSMSTWSMIAISPGCRRLVSALVDASTRTRCSSVASVPLADRNGSLIATIVPRPGAKVAQRRGRAPHPTSGRPKASAPGYRPGHVRGRLGDDDVRVGERGDLSKVGDDDHLGVPGKIREPAPNRHRCFASHARVDLVKEEGGKGAGFAGGQGHFQREHHPGEF